jgi:3-hydroxyisobutyrate dehydrogenase
MGFAMARNLARTGLEVLAWNRTTEKAEPLAAEGATVVGEPSAAVSGADLLVTMLSDADAVLDAAAPALRALPGPAIWIQTSTIGIEGTDRCLAVARDADVTFVDAPVLGTREPAEKAQLVVLASGPAKARTRCEPVFDAIGKRTLWLGEAGAGTKAKIVVNSWIVGVVGVLAETIALAQALQLDPGLFFEAVEGGTLDLPYARIKGQAMIERQFGDPAFRLSLSRKDAELVLAASGGAGLELPVMRAVTERLVRVERGGHGDEDMAATYWASPPSSNGAP